MQWDGPIASEISLRLAPRGLDPRVHPLRKKMDRRLRSAMTPDSGSGSPGHAVTIKSHCSALCGAGGTDYFQKAGSIMHTAAWHVRRRLLESSFTALLLRTLVVAGKPGSKRDESDDDFPIVAGALAAVMMAVAPVPAVAQPGTCGTHLNDWCPAPPGDPCGRHRNLADCRADPACYGMPYRGESLVACNMDERGFASNCPTVGCTSTPPRR